MKEKFVLEFTEQVVEDPIIYSIIKNYDVKVNILRAEISPGREGSMLVEIESDPERLAMAEAFLKERSVRLIPIAQSLKFKEDACIDCGACTAVCFSGCLTIGEPDWKLHVDRNNCIACGLCVSACPLGLFTLKFGT
ncbi:MAG: NIL domain-containing protein [Rectinemataceae bacterium]|nr:NIL domain-containing protein [Rectinemataceae bacterium]